MTIPRAVSDIMSQKRRAQIDIEKLVPDLDGMQVSGKPGTVYCRMISTRRLQLAEGKGDNYTSYRFSPTVFRFPYIVMQMQM